ncbi:hypothetical protein FHS26_001605 [Rhizobium pisi]|jgi:hypothetical protein|uniref:Uncharacterized protein n=1 Tax=Rhizobium pisi TaxID=574561 RepID=A0A7W5FYK3_9HYPH|nr:hypothetical protein [Rhizobium pisi]
MNIDDLKRFAPALVCRDMSVRSGRPHGQPMAERH